MTKRLTALFLTFVLTVSYAASVLGSTFKDLEQHPYEQEIELITDLGFIFYDEVPYYSPNMIITRSIAAEMVYILITGELNEIDEINYEDEIPDVSYYNYPIYFCRDNKILNGDDKGLFRPHDPVTLAQLVSMLIKGLELEENENMVYPEDYLELAARLGLTEGLSLEADDMLNNSDAAHLVYNCLNLPLFGDEKDKTLLETTFSELYETTKELNSKIDSFISQVNYGVETGTVDIPTLYNISEEIGLLTEDIYYANINAYYKYSAKLLDYYSVGSVLYYWRSALEEVEDLHLGNYNYNYYGWEVEYAEEELREYDNNMEYNLGDISDKYYQPVVRHILKETYKLLTEKLALLQEAMPTEEFLKDGIKEMEDWLADLLYMPRFDESTTGVVFESTNDFLYMVEEKYWELYSVYYDLHESGILEDDSYELQMDELYELVGAMAYLEVFNSISEEELKEFSYLLGEDYDFSSWRKEMLEYIIEYLEEMEFTYYPEQAKQVINKLKENL